MHTSVHITLLHSHLLVLLQSVRHHRVQSNPAAPVCGSAAWPCSQGDKVPSPRQPAPGTPEESAPACLFWNALPASARPRGRGGWGKKNWKEICVMMCLQCSWHLNSYVELILLIVIRMISLMIYWLVKCSLCGPTLTWAACYTMTGSFTAVWIVMSNQSLIRRTLNWHKNHCLLSSLAALINLWQSKYLNPASEKWTCPTAARSLRKASSWWI